MTIKDFKLSETSKSLLENLDLWEELEDKNGEKISGGAALPIQPTQAAKAALPIQPTQAAKELGIKSAGFSFEFENRVSEVINVTLLNGSTKAIALQPVGQPGDTGIANMPGSLITVEFDEIFGEGVNPVRRRMTSGTTGIFELQGTNMIVFSQ